MDLTFEFLFIALISFFSRDVTEEQPHVEPKGLGSNSVLHLICRHLGLLCLPFLLTSGIFITEMRNTVAFQDNATEPTFPDSRIGHFL